MQTFANRLAKMDKHYRKWARRQGITCFRIYNTDLPDFPFVIDRYNDQVVAAIWYQEGGKEDNPQWLGMCRFTMAETLGVSLDHVHIKIRRPQKGSWQYERLEETGEKIIVEEGGLSFSVNLQDYLDTGIFLDHRITRQRVKEEAAGRKVLNLFAYTGTFSVYAAAGGAESVLTVDMSATYLDWARENMTLNNFSDPQRYRYLKKDIVGWATESSIGRFDLIILDPPTFSNSKRMLNTWDVQRDHAFLLNQLGREMVPGGIIYFSNNFRKFQLDYDALDGFAIEDITVATTPNDFSGSKPHVAFRLERQ